MNPLLRLYARNRGVAGRRFAVRAAADEATIYIYDVIVNSIDEAEWFGGVAPETFVQALAAIDTPTIHLRINSPGGSVFGARAIEQAIAEHKSRIIAHVDGYAASAASFLMLPADEIIIAPGGMVMIHNAWGLAIGNAQDMRDTAALLDKIDGTLNDSYVKRTGASAEQVAAWMAAETWFTAEEAVAAHFADSIAADAGADANASLGWDLSAFQHAPMPRPPQPAKTDTAALLRRLAARERELTV